MRRLAFTIFTLLLSFILIIPSPVIAADDDTDETEIESLSKIYSERRTGDQMNLETWYGGKYGGTLEESIGFGDIILLDLIEKTSGGYSDDTDSLNELLESLFSYSPQSTKINPNDSAILASSKAITFLYQEPPASSIDYLANVKNNLQNHKIAVPAYADSGYGFNSLSPILPVWKAFRNVSYFVFVLGFIIYGFMIMFRVKNNPQTAINIQMALPKLILTLILITFSYAIAGFIIDLFYLIWGIIFNVLLNQDIITNAKAANKISGFSGGLFNGPFLATLLHLNFGGLIYKLWQAVLGLPTVVTDLLTHSLFIPISLILSLILSIVILITFVKIFWSLLKSYVNIILNIIFSPIILLGNLLPGSKSFGNWLKNIAAEISVFITTMLLFILAFYFIGPFKFVGIFNTSILSVNSTEISGDLWAPAPLQADGAVNSEGKLALLGLGIILMIPKLSEIIKNTLQIKDAGYGSAIGEAFMPIINPIKRQVVEPAQKQFQERVGSTFQPFINPKKGQDPNKRKPTFREEKGETRIRQ